MANLSHKNQPAQPIITLNMPFNKKSSSWSAEAGKALKEGFETGLISLDHTAKEAFELHDAFQSASFDVFRRHYYKERTKVREARNANAKLPPPASKLHFVILILILF